MARRLIAVAAALLIAASPAAAIERASPARGEIPSLAPAPALAAPTAVSLAPAARAAAAAPAAAAEALPALRALGEGPRPAELPVRVFDGAKVRPGALAVDAPGAPSPAEPPLLPPSRGPGSGGSSAGPRPPSPPRRGPGFKTGLVLGVLAAAAAPVLWNAVPPLILLATAPAGFLAAGAGWAAYASARAAARRVLALKPARRWSAAVLFSAGAAFGLTAGTLPQVYSGRLVEWGAGIFAPGRQVRRMPEGFRDEAIKVLSENPEGRKALDALRDRSGVIRAPRFYVGRLDSASGFSFPILDAVFIDPKVIESKGWTVDDFLSDPEKQQQLLRADAGLVFHELYHAVQFRKSLQPGQLESFPDNLFEYLTLEMEYEAYIHERLYEHEELKRDPKTDGVSVYEYERFLDDFDAYLKSIDDSSAYRLFKHVDARYYRDFLAGMRARHPALRAEGYELLAQRWPKYADEYREKARKARNP